MIKLSGGSTMVFESQVFSHPPQNSGSSAPYTIVHNKGRQGDLTQLYLEDGANWVEYMDANGVYGNQVIAATPNQTICYVYRVDSITHNIKFKIFWF